MIKRVTSDEKFRKIWESSHASGDKANAEAFKIYALWLCYGTKYDFCRFYAADDAMICGLGDSFVLFDFGDCDFEEMARFFSMNGFIDIFCSEHAGIALSKRMSCSPDCVNLMRFGGRGVPRGTERVDSDTPLEEFYGILKTGFEIEFEPWYLDMSHRVRHGVTHTRRLGKSVLVIQHKLFGSALISQVATAPDARGNGGASRLISAVCEELYESEIFVICEDKLCGFYEKNGFEKSGKKFVLRSV